MLKVFKESFLLLSLFAAILPGTAQANPQIRLALASLVSLETYKNNGNSFSPDEKVAINQHVTQVLTTVDCHRFKPISMNHNLKEQGTCGTWHSVPWLDEVCWSGELLVLLWTKDPTDWSNDCSFCCGLTSIITLGVWPASNLVCAGVVGISQALTYAASLPFRFCGTCDEYENELTLNEPLLVSFIQQAAILLEQAVKDNKVELSKEDQATLSRLTAFGTC